ncbi:uncharacterized protein LOC111372002 [Olea europaea subsp. europaea]|uniref:Uncharacterized protein LOC111372002 n=2 Tax=Olea europaea subsp. europaea TaxID=158383 RepID=A0A8S0R0U2_OLEEU|nr:uncharacterized protein LOC111372002 [Olea europaea subsp. europaea]
MDWFSWLSNTGLEPYLVRHYAFTFLHNELQQDDIAYFSHELLQSMGITVAKHRLEILKLAMKEKVRIHPMLWFIFAIKHTKTFLAKHIQGMVLHENSALVPKRNYSLRWKIAMLQRNKKLKATKPERQMLLTNGDYAAESGRKMLMLTNRSIIVDSKSTRSDQNLNRIDKNSRIRKRALDYGKVDSDNGEIWSSSVKEIMWDTMFQNLKPT